MSDPIDLVARWLHDFATTWGGAESEWDDADQGEYRYQAARLLAELRGES